MSDVLYNRLTTTVRETHTRNAMTTHTWLSEQWDVPNVTRNSTF